MMTNGTNGASRPDAVTASVAVDELPPADTAGATAPKAKEEPKLAEVLVQLVVAQSDLFHDARGVAHATVSIATPDGANVATLTLRLRSRRLRSWLAYAARVALGQTVSASTLEEAITALEGIACFDRPQRDVYVRVAEHEQTIYIDLGDETGQVIEAAASGWQIIDSAPARFVRPSGLLPLVRPVRGGNIEELRPFVNVDADGFILFAAWLVASLRPHRPCAALAVTGEQGTAKTTACKVARSLTDPNVADLRSPPRNEDDLLIAATNSHVIALDNVSGLAPWLSDALCRVITGGGIGKRTLYSDEDETILEAIRPVLLNGIEDVADRPDLAERCIALTLLPIDEKNRRDEATYWVSFKATAPRILGALLDGLVSAIANVDAVRLPKLPRMADFIKFTSAAETGLGFAHGSIGAAYERNRTLVIAAALDASPIATALRTLLAKKGGKWEGTPTKLLGDLGQYAPRDADFARTWPKNASRLSNKLRRAATALRQIGILVEEGHRDRGNAKERWLTITDTSPANTKPKRAKKRAKSKEKHRD